MEVTGLKRLIGLPVIMDGKAAGHVMRGVLTDDGRQLRGIVMRGGLRGPRWLPRDQIQLVGKVSVIAKGTSLRVPRSSTYRLFRVSDPEGLRLGVVTDALLSEDSLRVMALEVSSGPVDDLIDGRWYATAFEVRKTGDTGHVTVPFAKEEVRQ